MTLCDNGCSNDKFIWRCNLKTCRTSVTIRDRSFFSHSKIPLGKSLLLIYLWSVNYTAKDAVRETEMSKASVIDWFRFCRDICVDYFYRNDDTIGGEGIIVEIDESLLSKRNYNRGRLVGQQWVFGAITRDTPVFQCIVELVPDRSQETLLEVIKRRIRPGSIIMSDCWKSYDCLEANGYRHYNVNHSENFVNPDDSNIHTQNIENRWNWMKKFIKKKGTNIQKHLEDYVLEYLYKRKFQNVAFDQFILDINNIDSIENNRLVFIHYFSAIVGKMNTQFVLSMSKLACIHDLRPSGGTQHS